LSLAEINLRLVGVYEYTLITIFRSQMGCREHWSGGPAQGRPDLRVRRRPGDVEHAQLGEPNQRLQAAGAREAAAASPGFLLEAFVLAPPNGVP
jgi:hypothetical protein